MCIRDSVKAVKHHFDYFEIQEAGQKIIELVDITNKYVTDNAPWTLAKEGQMDKCGEVLTNVLPVSYAHLDVYKRQDSSITNRKSLPDIWHNLCMNIGKNSVINVIFRSFPFLCMKTG